MQKLEIFCFHLGNPNAELLKQLKKKVDWYTRDVTADYIGTCSGDDRYKAMKRRNDSYKKENCIDTMIAIYESYNQEHCFIVERELLKYHGVQTGTNINRVGGGGGRKSKGPRYQVYIAISS